MSIPATTLRVSVAALKTLLHSRPRPGSVHVGFSGTIAQLYRCNFPPNNVAGCSLRRDVSCKAVASYHTSTFHSAAESGTAAEASVHTAPSSSNLHGEHAHWPTWESIGVAPHLIGRLQNRLKLTKAAPLQRDTHSVILDALPTHSTSPKESQSNFSKDVLLLAPTGSGKTLAYLLPILHGLHGKILQSNTTQVVILVPTRELAHQTHNTVLQLLQPGNKKDAGARVMKLVGQISAQALQQIRTAPPHVVISTPATFAQLAVQMSYPMHSLRALVLDEADELVRNYHIASVKAVVQRATKMTFRPSIIAVSATTSQGLQSFLQQHARQGTRLAKLDFGGGELSCPISISHYIMRVPTHAAAFNAFTRCLATLKPTAVLAFCNSAATLEALEVFLQKKNIATSVIGNAYANAERAKSIASITTGQSLVLLSTEMAARGLDIPRLSHVFNFDLPSSAREYVHRAGRVGRLTATGLLREGCVVSWCVEGRADSIGAQGGRVSDAQHLTHIINSITASCAELVMLPGGAHELRPWEGGEAARRSTTA